MDDPWAAVAEDRQVFAALLASLSPAEWDASSCCAPWTNREVAGHVLSMATVAKGAALRTYLAAGCDLDATNARLLTATIAGRTDGEIVDALREHAPSHHAPPGLKPLGVLGELVTHLADVAHAAGRPVELPEEHLTATLAYLARRVKGNTRFTLTRHGRRPVLDCHDRVEGVHLRATDVDWTHGSGPLVEGPALALVLAMTGRPAALDALTGAGVALLRSR